MWTSSARSPPRTLVGSALILSQRREHAAQLLPLRLVERVAVREPFERLQCFTFFMTVKQI